MADFIVVFNHSRLTAEQEEAVIDLGCKKTVYPPNECRDNWQNISPSSDRVEGMEIIKNFILKSTNPYDYVLIQGEFGATYKMVSFCFKHGRIPVYATSRRESVEERQPDGSVVKKSVFKFVRFREYER